MNDSVRQTLSEIVSKYGPSLAGDPRRCEALLRDFCGRYKKEIHLLVSALRERVAADLMSPASALPGPLLRARLAGRLQDNLGFSEEASEWAVDSWAIALGVTSIAEGAAREPAPAPTHAEAHEADYANDPDDPFIDEVDGGPSRPPPEEIFRQAVRVILADDHTSDYEKADLRVIRQRLGIPVGEARRIFAEIKSEGRQPDNRPPANSKPVNRARAATAAASSAAALVVSARGGERYRKIGDAVEDAPPGARIIVRPGLYRESLIIDKPVEIVGDGAVEQIIIESEGAPCLLLRAPSCALRGLSLRSRSGEAGGHFAVDISYGKPLMEGCDIAGESGGCVSIHGPATAPHIKRCKVHDGAGYGIWVWDNASGTIEDCEIYNNIAAGVMLSGDTMEEARRMAAYVMRGDPEEDLPGAVFPGGTRAGAGANTPAGARPVILRCDIRDGLGHGVWVHYKGRGSVEHCRVSGNASAGVWVDQGSDSVIRHSSINGNGWEGVRITGESAGVVEDCDLRENGGGAWAIEHGSRVRASGNQE